MGKHYVIGDLHGCFNALMELLKKLNLNANDKVYFVGDILDRAPTPAEQLALIKWCLENIKIGGQFSMTIGNHEYQARAEIKATEYNLKLLNEPVTPESIREILPFVSNSYSTYADLATTDVDWLKVRDFIDALPLYINLDLNGAKYIITHSWLCNKYGESIVEEFSSARGSSTFPDAYMSIWDRDCIYERVENVTIIHGHTRTISHRYDFCNPDRKPIPIRIGNNINIDTSCFQGKGVGNLTAYCIEEDTFIQAWD